MTITDMIARLQGILEDEGDLPVVMSNDSWLTHDQNGVKTNPASPDYNVIGDYEVVDDFEDDNGVTHKALELGA